MPCIVALVLFLPHEMQELGRTGAWVREVYHADLVTSGVDYPLRRSGYVIGGENLSPARAAAYLPVLRRELAEYPSSLLERTRTRNIILARKLSINGQLRAAVPDFATMNLYLDVERGRDAPTYQERVFHHEFFHLIDYLQSGPSLKDADWAKLNPADFRYGSGGARMQDRGNNPFMPTRTIPGFLTLYGTAAVEEDKAELFSFLLADSLFLGERAANDAVVRAKLGQVKRQLHRFCPALDEGYFARLAAQRTAVAVLPTVHLLLTMTGAPAPPCLAWCH